MEALLQPVSPMELHVPPPLTEARLQPAVQMDFQVRLQLTEALLQPVSPMELHVPHPLMGAHLQHDAQTECLVRRVHTEVRHQLV